MFRLFENVRSSSSAAVLHENLRDAVGNLGFESFHFGAHAPVKASGGDARFVFDGVDQKSSSVISSYPSSWFERYQEQKYIEIDPLVKHCSKSIIPVVWHMQTSPLERRSITMFDEAREHGLVAGATYSVFGEKGEIAIMSLTTSKEGTAEKRNIETRLSHGYMLLAYLHEATKKLASDERNVTMKFFLTPRERECLLWVSVGKTSWEIAKILSISERTAIFHIDNVNKKLGSNTRAQAVAKALSAGLISP